MKGIDKEFYDLLVKCRECQRNENRFADNPINIITFLMFLLDKNNSLIRKMFCNFLGQKQFDIFFAKLSNSQRAEIDLDTLAYMIKKKEKTFDFTIEEIKQQIIDKASEVSSQFFWMSLEEYLKSIGDVMSFYLFNVDGDVFMADYEIAYAFAQLDENKSVSLADFEYALIDSNSPTLKRIFCDVIGEEKDLNQLYYLASMPKDNRLGKAKKEIEDKGFKSNTNQCNIPEEIKGFLTVLNSKYNVGEECEIQGRDQEVHQIWMKASKREKPNSVLVGPAGVGKTAIIEKITWQIVNKKCPERFEGYTVLELSVNNMIAGTQYRGMAEERFKNVVQFLETTPKIILFIDEIHMIIGAGTTKGSESGGFDEVLKPLLARGDARVIGATTDEEYEKYFSSKGALKRRFEKISVDEPDNSELYPMIKKKIEALEKFHGATISNEMLNYIILYASCLNNETRNPDRTIDAIDNVMVNTVFMKKQAVDKESIYKAFEKQFNSFKNMGIEDKKSIAYHEVGHYLLWNDCKRTDKELVALSIVPGDGYLGCNAFRRKQNGILLKDRDFYIHEIAELLAGRIAEQMYTETISSGAESDLKKATLYALKLITKYGMGKEIGVDRVYFDTDTSKMFDEVLIGKINKEIDGMILEAREIAERVLNENKELLEVIVNKLLKKGLLSRKELLFYEAVNKTLA